MILFTVAPLMALYVYWRAVRALGRGPQRLFSVAVLALGATFPIVVDTFGGSLLAPTLDGRLMIAGEFFLLVLLESALLVALRDGLLLISRVVGQPILILRTPKAVVFLLVLATFVSLYAVSQALRDPVVKRVTLDFENLPDSFVGIRIAQLSDLHQANIFGPERLKRIVHATNQLNADIIVITGDLVDGSVKSRGKELDALRNLVAPEGIYVVEGNHEHYVDYDGWMAFFPKLGLKLLRNEHAVLRRGNDALLLAGLTDYGAKRFGRAAPDLTRALKGAPEGFTIVLSHQPREVKKWTDSGVDLMLCGHTHGGQTPLVSLLVKALNDGYVRGLYTEKSADGKALSVYVHPGTGLWTGFSARLASENEIALITLTKKGK